MPFPVKNPCAGITVLGSELGSASYLLGVGSNGCLVYEAPSDLVCRVFTALPPGGAAVFGSTALVGADCKTYTIDFMETPLTVSDSATVDLTASGAANHTLTASVKLSTSANNATVINGDGIYTPNVCAQLGLLATVSPWTITDKLVYVNASGECQTGTPPPVNITFEGNIGAPQTVNLFPADPTRIVRIRGVAPLETTISSANVDISLNRCLFGAYVPAGTIAAANYLGIDAAGCLVKSGVASGEGTTVSDTNSVNLTLTGVDISADVKVSATAGNLLAVNPDGLYVPSLCATITALDTVTDANVPATADVVYVRTDGSCGRAPLSAAVAADVCTSLQALTVNPSTLVSTARYVNVRADGVCELLLGNTALCEMLASMNANNFRGAGTSTTRYLGVDSAGQFDCGTWTIPTVDPFEFNVQAPVAGAIATINAANPTLVVRAFNSSVQLGAAAITAPNFLDITFPNVCLQLDALPLVATPTVATDRLLVKRGGTLGCDYIEFQNMALPWAVDPQTFSITTPGDGSVSSPWAPEIRISTFNNNAATLRTNNDGNDGLYVPNACAQLAALPAAVYNANMELMVRNSVTGACNRISYVPDFGHCAELTGLTLQAQPLGAEMLAYDPATATCVRIAVPSGGTGSESTTVADTASVDLTLTGFQITADVKLSTAANQALALLADGLHVPTVCSVVAALAPAAVNGTTRVLGYDSNTGGCVLVPASGGSVTVTDTNTVNLTVTGQDITADVLISSNAGNILSGNATGLYVPPLCSLMGSLDAATDTVVPATATVTYVRADGTCGRAVLPTAAGGGVVTATDTPTIDFTITGTDITGSVRVSSSPNQSLQAFGDGLYVESACAQLTSLGAGTANSTSRILVIDTLNGNCAQVSLCQLIEVLDTTTDTNVPATAEIVYYRTDGSCGRAPMPAAAVGGLSTATDSSTVDFTIAGSDITASVILDGVTGGNALVANADGLWAPDFCTGLFNLSTAVPASATVEIPVVNRGTGVCTTTTLCSLLNVLDTATDADVPATAEVIYVRADGSCGRATIPAAAAGGITTATDSGTVDFTVSGSDITAVVRISASAFNSIVANADGIYAPNLCAQLIALPVNAAPTANANILIEDGGICNRTTLCLLLNALDTTTDGTVPSGAEVVYVRADGTCGRAAVPGAAGGGVVTATDTPSIDFTITGTDITGNVNVSGDVTNSITIDPTGIYAPNLCTSILNLGVGDPEVPATAHIPYRRADGSCGRAPLPVIIATVTDTPAINLTITGTDLTAALTVSSTAGNSLVINADGAYVPDWCTAANNLGTTDANVPATAMVTYVRADGTCGRATIPAAAAGGIVTATDSGSIDFTVSGSDITAVVKLSTDADNATVFGVDGGVYTPTLCASIQALAANGAAANTNGTFPYYDPGSNTCKTVRPAEIFCSAMSAMVASTPANNFIVPYQDAGGACGVANMQDLMCAALSAFDTATDAEVPATGEVIYVRADGSCGRATIPAAAAGGVTTATDSTSVDFTVAGSDITAVVIVDPVGTNALTINPAGLYVPDLCTQLSNLTQAIASTTTVLLGIDTVSNACDRFTLCSLFNTVETAIDANVPATADVLYVRADGTCGRAPIPAAAAGGITTATDSTSVDFTVAGSDITATVIISPDAGNQITNPGNGLFVPSLCTQLSALDSASDASVPLNAEVSYVRADNSCGRAPLPVNAFSIDTDSGSGSRITITPAPTPAQPLFTILGAGGASGITVTNAGNSIIVGANPCDMLAALDTATDANVPATADLVYVRADGTCGRAPAAAGSAITCAAIQATFVAGAGLIPSTSGVLISNGTDCQRITMSSPCTLTNVGVTGLVGNAAGDLQPGRLAVKSRFTSVSANATLQPNTTDILLVNNAGGNITITLATPAACEPNVFHVKQTAPSSNTITLSPASGTIDGASVHVFGNALGSAGESRMIAFDGTNWHIL